MAETAGKVYCSLFCSDSNQTFCLAPATPAVHEDAQAQAM